MSQPNGRRIFAEHAADRYAAYRAGTNPADCVHPLAIKVMAENGLDINAQMPTNVGEYLGRLSVRHLIVVCDAANEKCLRVWPGMNRMFWPFDDPAVFVGSQAATLEKFRAVRDQIETRIKQWLEAE